MDIADIARSCLEGSSSKIVLKTAKICRKYSEAETIASGMSHRSYDDSAVNSVGLISTEKMTIPYRIIKEMNSRHIGRRLFN